MNLIKYIFLSIINSITNLLPISYNSHIIIFQNTFNTKLFDNNYLNSFLNISLFITIILIFHKSIFKYMLSIFKSIIDKNKTSYKNKSKYLKCLFISSIISTIIYILIPKKTYNIKIIALSYILTSLILLSSTNKKGTKKYKDITYIDSIIIGLSNIFTIVPTISPLCANLFLCSKRNFDKNTTIKYSFICLLPILLINSAQGIIFIISNQEYILLYSICISISIFISFYIFDFFSYIYYEQKLYKLSIYCFIIAIFLLYWFR